MSDDPLSTEHCFEAVRARGTRGIALLIGAGCSFTAGIPLAGGFVQEIRKSYSVRCKGLDDVDANEKYAWATSKLSDGEWRDLFGSTVNEAKLNVAHLCIAELIDHGIVDRVLTTNFDSLLVRACALGKKFPLIHDCAAVDHLDDWVEDGAEAIVYLHGQEHGRKMLNPSRLQLLQLLATKAGSKTAEEPEAKRDGPDDPQGKLLRKLLDARASIVSRMVIGTVRRQPLIVCGYSGATDEVFRKLQDADNLNFPVFWLAHTGADRSSAQFQFRRDELKERVFVIHREKEKFGADEFFYELLLALGKSPPAMLQLPSSETRLASANISWPDQDWEEWKRERVRDTRDTRPGSRRAGGPIMPPLLPPTAQNVRDERQEPPVPANDVFAELTVQKEAPAWEESFS